MAKLPRTKKLIQEDFPSERSWIGKLLQPLNQFLESTNLALDKGLTITDNLDQQTVQVTVTGNEEVSFPIKTRSKPLGVVVSRVELIEGSDAPTAAVQPVSWEVDSTNNIVTIDSWHGGLNASSRYRITLWIHTS